MAIFYPGILGLFPLYISSLRLFRSHLDMVGREAEHVVPWYYKNEQQLNEVHVIYSIFFLSNHTVIP